MPALTEETRQDYIKQARAEAENSRVSIRNIRRDANQAAKEKQQSSEISEDELRRIEDLIQKETDKFISIVDSDLKNKESDLLEIQWPYMANTSKINTPKHVAIIMDGNGRWAIKNSLKISEGHKKGVSIVKDIVEESVKQDLSSLSLIHI